VQPTSNDIQAGVAVWVLVVVAGLAVELTAIVLLGRSVTRRDEDRDRPASTAIVDEARATIVARGYVGRTGADVLRGAAGSLGDCGRRRITVELPQALTGDPGGSRVLAGPAEELPRTAPRMRLEWSAQAGPPALGLVPEPRRGD
jgi:hypothetical protein